MDRLTIRGRRPLHVRSGHTPVNIGLLLGSLLTALPSLATSATRSGTVGRVLSPAWLTVFYAVLIVSACISLAGISRQLPTVLDATTYPIIIRRLVMERVGLYGVVGIMTSFSCAALLATGWNALNAAGWLFGIAGGLAWRIGQTHVDLNKLHRATTEGVATDSAMVADPDDESGAS